MVAGSQYVSLSVTMTPEILGGPKWGRGEGRAAELFTKWVTFSKFFTFEIHLALQEDPTTTQPEQRTFPTDRQSESFLNGDGS